eukprot:sb/3470624/
MQGELLHSRRDLKDLITSSNEVLLKSLVSYQPNMRQHHQPALFTETQHHHQTQRQKLLAETQQHHDTQKQQHHSGYEAAEAIQQEKTQQIQNRVRWLENRIEQVLLIHRQTLLDARRGSESEGDSEEERVVREDIKTVNTALIPDEPKSPLKGEDTVTTNTATTKSVKSHKATSTTTRFTVREGERDRERERERGIGREDV